MCFKVITLLAALALPATPASKPAPAAWLDCGFDAANIYRCRP